MPDIEIGTLDRAHITFAPWTWPFAIAARGKIDDYFTKLQSEIPAKHLAKLNLRPRSD